MGGADHLAVRVLGRTARFFISFVRGEAEEVSKELVFGVRRGAPMSEARRGRQSSATESV
jgi:hypothetical protein